MVTEEDTKNEYYMSEDSIQTFLSDSDEEPRKDDEDKALISKIILPSSDSSESPHQGNIVSVEFIRPTGHRFWEAYPITKSYISEDNRFAKLVETTGHSLSDLENVVGESVSLDYEKKTESWTVDSSMYGNNKTGTKDVIQVREKITYFVYGFVGLMISVILGLSIVYESGIGLLIGFVLILTFVQIKRARKSRSQ